MIEYKWYVSNLEVRPLLEGKENVVHTVHWRVRGEETVNNKTYVADMYGALSVELNAEGDFIEFADLTEEDVVAWVKSHQDVESCENSIATQIELQKNPVSISPPLPWNIQNTDV
jgi:hypothetical protein